MSIVRRSSQSWFKAWDRIISLEDTLSRIQLSEKSGASVWIIKSLQTDWMQQNDVIWDKRVFKHYKPNNLSLSFFTRSQKERMK